MKTDPFDKLDAELMFYSGGFLKKKMLEQPDRLAPKFLYPLDKDCKMGHFCDINREHSADQVQLAPAHEELLRKAEHLDFQKQQDKTGAAIDRRQFLASLGKAAGEVAVVTGGVAALVPVGRVVAQQAKYCAMRVARYIKARRGRAGKRRQGSGGSGGDTTAERSPISRGKKAVLKSRCRKRNELNGNTMKKRAPLKATMDWHNDEEVYIRSSAVGADITKGIGTTLAGLFLAAGAKGAGEDAGVRMCGREKECGIWKKRG